jgi:hypothetical protein
MRKSLSFLSLLVLLGAGLDGRAVAAETLTIAVDDFSYTDTSAEVTDQTAAHERRLKAFMAALRQGIAADPRYRLGPAAAPDAAFKIIGGVQKTSTLVQWAKAVVIDVAAKKTVMEKLYTFRGDNDESWERAEKFLSRDIRAALAAAASPIALAVFDFELEDMTAATEAASAASDASYLAEVSGSVREALGRSGRYRIVDVGGAGQETPMAQGLRGCNGCEAAIARKLGADQSLIGVVRRVSRTEYTLGFQVRGARTGEVQARGDSGLRMGADYSWKRGAVRLVSDRLIENR